MGHLSARIQNLLPNVGRPVSLLDYLVSRLLRRDLCNQTSFLRLPVIADSESKRGDNEQLNKAQENALTNQGAAILQGERCLTVSSAFKTHNNLRQQGLVAGGEALRLIPGMQVAAEIRLGKRSVLEYLLLPVQKTVKETGREW